MLGLVRGSRSVKRRIWNSRGIKVSRLYREELGIFANLEVYKLERNRLWFTTTFNLPATSCSFRNRIPGFFLCITHVYLFSFVNKRNISYDPHEISRNGEPLTKENPNFSRDFIFYLDLFY